MNLQNSGGRLRLILADKDADSPWDHSKDVMLTFKLELCKCSKPREELIHSYTR